MEITMKENPTIDPIIEGQKIAYTYSNAEKPSLREVTLTVKSGECIVLCGKSGSGKTTFTRLLNGLCPSFFHGELSGVCICGGRTAGEAAVEDYVCDVGSVFQNPKTQYFNTDTTAELAFPCENTGMPSGQIRQRIKECSEQFGIGQLLNRNIFKLSGGEKQRIAFAAACMLKPRILVLDEPTSNLDQNAVSQLRQMILTMKSRGITVVLAEHRLAWLKGVADHYFFFEEGKLTESWTAEAFYRLSREELYQRGLRALELAHLRQIVLEKSMRGCQTSLLLTAENLNIGFHKNNPIYGLASFSLHEGEIVGLMGHNGIGKSTLAKTLCGLQKPLSGNIYWRGRQASKKELIRHCFLVMQDVNYQLFADSVREEVLLGAAVPQQCDEVLRLLGLEELADRHPMSLSGGQKQRVAVAAAMLSGKELVLLDEPTSGLDHYHMTQVGKLLRQLKTQGKCVLIITHDEELAAQWCDRVIQLKDNTAEEEEKWS